MSDNTYHELSLALTDQGYKFCFREETASTNDWALEEYKKGKREPSLFLTAKQTSGKGRLGRSWTSASDSSLTFSVLLPARCDAALVPSYTLIFGLAVCTVFRNLCGCDALIKWPNDVVCSGKKLCGILTESCPGLEYIVIGTGINLKKQAYPKELSYKAISLEECSHALPDTTELIPQILEQFECDRNIFLKDSSLTGLRERYSSLLVNIGRTTVITEKNLSISGKATGIDDFGRLEFIREDGEKIRIGSGEASVSGIY